MTEPVSIEDRFLLENYLLGLVFPGNGFVFFRIDNVADYEYLYDRILTEAGLTELTGDQWIDPIRMLDSSGNNILEVEEDLHLYQIFYGIDPSALKTYKCIPKTTLPVAPDVTTVTTKSWFSYIDGFKSPLDKPHVSTETWLPYGSDLIAFAFHWSRQDPGLYPLMRFTGKMYNVTVIKDVDLIQQLIKPGAKVALRTVGFLDPFRYDPTKPWGVKFIPFGADRAAIEKAVLPKERRS